MYSLIIADDEKIIREGLTTQIDWNNLGFEIVGAYSDGSEIIDFLDSMPVDVVLTDIMMTHIGGIDVARYIHDTGIPSKVVFISGHKEFELALQAIRYGVEEYILKPSKVEQVEAVFTKIRNELDAKARDQEYRDSVERRWEKLHPIIEEKFLSNLVIGALEDKEDIKRRMQLLYPEIMVEYCPCVLMNLEIKNYGSFIQEEWNYNSGQFEDAVYNFVAMYQGIASFHVVYKYKEKIRLFAIMKEYRNSKEENEALCRMQVEQFGRQFREIFGTEISIEVNRVFEQIYQVTQWREDMIRKDDRQDDAEILLQEQKKMILTNIMQGNISTAQKILDHLLNSLAKDDMRYCRNVLVDIFSCISEQLRENNQQLFKVLQPFIDYHIILNMDTPKELERYCKRIFDKMKSKESMPNQFNKNAMVNRIKGYIQEHIFEDILLEDVGNAVFLSNTHLSRIFKTQIGEPFSQYVTRKKMEKAAELLHDPQYKVYQVGEMLGYKTARYFSKVFNNVMGYYPGQYRKDVLHMGECADEEAQV